AEGIAKINGAIALTQGNGSAAPDLLDQRDRLVNDLSRRLPVSTVIQDDGTMNVFIGKGQGLVVGVKASALETVHSTTDPGKLDIRFEKTASSISEFLNGGEIGGLLDFQTKVLDPAQNKLGLMAIGVAQTVNEQHAKGLDLDGKIGGDFFAPPAPKVSANAANAGSGAASVAIADLGALQPSDYELKYDGSSYSLLRLSDNKVVSNSVSLPATLDGMEISLSGAPVAGDRFLIQPTRSGAKDFKVAITDPRAFAAADAAGGTGNNGNALALANLQTERKLLDGSSSFHDVQGKMTAEVGIQGSSARAALKAQTALLDQSTQARDNVSGVNLDEEAANLMKYQQAYEAAARVVQVGDSIIQTLLDAVRR
ncbi:MAG: flagellar hook-associated protein FlgK, partial [Candidatus Competibacteraceae bacterium]|nr:flagellar hook-associated protein FlgK [Candidatus Competibacteraceae bacterium]